MPEIANQFHFFCGLFKRLPSNIYSKTGTFTTYLGYYFAPIFEHIKKLPIIYVLSPNRSNSTIPELEFKVNETDIFQNRSFKRSRSLAIIVHGFQGAANQSLFQQIKNGKSPLSTTPRNLILHFPPPPKKPLRIRFKRTSKQGTGKISYFPFYRILPKNFERTRVCSRPDVDWAPRPQLHRFHPLKSLINALKLKRISTKASGM